MQSMNVEKEMYEVIVTESSNCSRGLCKRVSAELGATIFKYWATQQYKQKPIEIKMCITGHLSKRFSVDHNK